MLVIVWEYQSRPDRTEEFESFYRPDGPWDCFFRDAPGFVGTSLMKDTRTPGRYVVSDRWTSLALYEDFKRGHAAEYAALSERGARLYARETEVGRFDFVD
jgi:heme-degrading monooxygenase HmoA